MSMVWHIFRKDLKLLWKMLCGVAALYLLQLFPSARHIDPLTHGALSRLVSAAALIATGLLVVFVVQKDAVPGLRQDWLVRPIRRTDLLLSKIAFTVLMIQFPIFLFDFVRNLLVGFPPGLAVSAAFAWNAQMLVVYLLPLLAFATLTRNLAEALTGAFGLGLATLLFLTSVASRSETMNSTMWWIPQTMQTATTLTAVAIILGLQYYGRKTVASRWVCAVTVLVGILFQLMPWKTAFAMQERFSAEPEAAAAVQIHFEKGPRKATVSGDAGLLTGLRIPVSIKGVGPSETLYDDRVDARIVEKDGTAFDFGRTTVDGHSLDYDDNYLWLTVSRDILKSGTARIELDYYLTLFRMTADRSLPVNSTQWVDGMGICTSEADFGATELELNCRFAKAATLIKWSFVSATSVWSQSYPNRFGLGLSSRIARLPLGPDLKNTKLEMRAYEPLAHFTRHVVIPISDLR